MLANPIYSHFDLKFVFVPLQNETKINKILLLSFLDGIVPPGSTYSAAYWNTINVCWKGVSAFE